MTSLPRSSAAAVRAPAKANTNTNDSGDLYAELSKYLCKEKSLDTVHIQRVLQNWKDGKYPLKPGAQSVVVVLSDPESGADKGLKGLKGADARMAESLLPIARKLGFSVFLSTIKKTVTGIPDKEAWLYPLIPAWKRARHGDDEHYMDLNDGLYREDPERWADDLEAYRSGNFDMDGFDMGAIDDEEYELTQVIDITTGDDGVPVKRNASWASNIDEEAVIPKDAFDDADTEEEDFDNESGELIHLYYPKPCLVLFRKVEKKKAPLPVKGLTSPSQVLASASSSTPEAPNVVHTTPKELGISSVAQEGSTTSEMNKAIASTSVKRKRQ